MSLALWHNKDTGCSGWLVALMALCCCNGAAHPQPVGSAYDPLIGTFSRVECSAYCMYMEVFEDGQFIEWARGDLARAGPWAGKWTVESEYCLKMQRNPPLDAEYLYDYEPEKPFEWCWEHGKPVWRRGSKTLEYAPVPRSSLYRPHARD